MEFSEEKKQKNSIVSYNNLQIELADNTLKTPCFLSADYQTNLEITKLIEIDNAMIEPLLSKTKFDILLIGTGDIQQFLASKQQFLLQKLKIGVEVMNTPSACRSYNLLLSDFREVALILL